MMSKSSMFRFAQRVDYQLKELFETTLIIGGITVTAASAGGRVVNEYIDGGESGLGTMVMFRVLKSAWPGGAPFIGMMIDWIPQSGSTIGLEISHVGNHPHDPSWHIGCRQRHL